MYRSLLLVPLLLQPTGRADAHLATRCFQDRYSAGRGAAAADDVVLVIRGYSDGGAIPIPFFLNPYRVISDTYGVFVYDPDCGFARFFSISPAGGMA